jgi:hypothetical protein
MNHKYQYPHLLLIVLALLMVGADQKKEPLSDKQLCRGCRPMWVTGEASASRGVDRRAALGANSAVGSGVLRIRGSH